VKIAGKTIGFAITGSYCTHAKTLPIVTQFVQNGAKVIPILSENVAITDTRFGRAEDLIDQLFKATGYNPITSINGAEPIGPKEMLDALVIAPCTGNTLAKMANGVTDTSVTMAAKAHIRNNRPVIIAISTNDGLGNSCKNIGALLNMKNIYFVPFGQDDPINKNNSLVAHFDYILQSTEKALDSSQIQPIVKEYVSDAIV
jgi:dipicolinate synthase subunit B